MKVPDRNVLVIEDESAQRIMYAKALRSMEFNVAEAENAGKALEHLESHPVAVILLDLHLGRESGLDLFERIREQFPAISVVIATGYGDFGVAKQAIRMDVVDFLSKPISLDDLRCAMDRSWERHLKVLTPVADFPSVGDGDEDRALESLLEQRGDLNLEVLERAAIMESLRRAEDNRKMAAAMLGISERTLYYRLSQYRLR